MKYNRIDDIYKIPISAFDKSAFYTPEMCVKILYIFWGGIRTTKFLYKTNR